jgi:hypothetical protein
LALSLLSFSCAGGSGSSGFDFAENTAIEMALDEQRCVESEGLTICPAGMATPPPATRTATPLPPAPTPTPTNGVIDVPTETPATPPAQVTATAAPSATATPTETSTPIPTSTVDRGMTVDTSFDSAADSTCIPTDTPGICILPFVFATQGFSLDTNYQVAARNADDDPWELFDAIHLGVNPQGSLFGSDIPINTLAQDPTAGIFIQTAVLVFVEQAPFLPPGEIIESLSESGADFAYVSPQQEVRTRGED